MKHKVRLLDGEVEVGLSDSDVFEASDMVDDS